MKNRNRKKIDFIIDKNNCYICNSHAKDKDGYARYYKDNKGTKVHRHVYEECFGEIPENMLIRHRCDNPSCINPEHLELGTNRENKNDMMERNRTLKGENHPSNKLNWDDIYKIRDMYSSGKSQNEIANVFKISQKNVSKIVNKLTWKEGTNNEK